MRQTQGGVVRGGALLVGEAGYTTGGFAKMHTQETILTDLFNKSVL